MADLEYLVVDEADRILRQSYQGWLPLVLASARQRLPRMMIGERGSSSQRLKKIVVSATLTHDPARLAVFIYTLLICLQLLTKKPWVTHVIFFRIDLRNT